MHSGDTGCRVSQRAQITSETNLRSSWCRFWGSCISTHNKPRALCAQAQVCDNAWSWECKGLDRMLQGTQMTRNTNLGLDTSAGAVLWVLGPGTKHMLAHKHLERFNHLCQLVSCTCLTLPTGQAGGTTQAMHASVTHIRGTTRSVCSRESDCGRC